MTPFTPYQKRLFAFLSVACFFEGYDFFALAQILPNLREDFGLTQSVGGLIVALVNVGTIVAYLLIRRADQWGRRRVLMVTIAGYTICTAATGFAWDVYSFTFFQFFARMFLIAEWATSMVYAAEEFPAERRGMVIGVIQACTSLGAVICAGIVPTLLHTGPGWRTVYFVGVIPLILMAFARQGLKESQRFVAQEPTTERAPLTAILRSEYRVRVFQLAAIWLLTYACQQSAITFWKEFAVAERSMTDGDVAFVITIGALASMPLVFAAGKLIDVIGRRRGAVIIYIVAAAAVFAMYNLHGKAVLTVAMVLGVFGVSAVFPILNAYTTELFPTRFRGDAFAWSNNLLGRLGYVLSPLVVGLVAQQWSWSGAVSSTTVLPLVALVLILLWLPETTGRELEEIAELD